MPTSALKLDSRSGDRLPQTTQVRADLARMLTLAAMSLGHAVVQLDVTAVNTALASIWASLEGGVRGFGGAKGCILRAVPSNRSPSRTPHSPINQIVPRPRLSGTRILPGPAMYQVLLCLSAEHDWRLVALAAAVCFLASTAAISLFQRARASLLLDSALENMSQGLCMFDADGRILLFNERYLNMMGRSGLELQGRLVVEVLRELKTAGRWEGDPDKFIANLIAEVRAGHTATRISSSSAARSALSTSRCVAADGSRPSRTSPNGSARRRRSRIWRGTTR